MSSTDPTPIDIRPESSLGEGFMPVSDPNVGEGAAEVLLTLEYQHLADEVRKRLGTDALARVREAYELAEECHAGQMRKSGDPYLIHPLRVARTLAGLGLDTPSVIAGILHDTVEDSELTVFDLTERFGREVAMLVDGVTKLGKVPYLSTRENQAESFRKMLVAMSRDIRVLLVKLCDRLDNMRTLEAMPAHKQRRIAQETADIFAPLARLLGIDWLRRELADLSFRYLEPVVAQEIRAQMVVQLTENPTLIDTGLELIQTAFLHELLPGTGEVEPAGPGELLALSRPRWRAEVFGTIEWRASVLNPQEVHELRTRGRTVEKLRDMVTYQVLTRDRETCYLALGHLHAHFKPVPGSVRDYVALPRANRYQGLHTQVLDRHGQRMFIEIRSLAMDAIAERGVVVELQKGLEASELGWLREMMGWQEEVEDPNEFIEAVKRELFADQVFVFTPEGDLRTFPKGSTPIDFAFAIHTDVGLRTAGARINGQIVPLRYKLRQGDTIEILTDPKVEPREEWLDLVHSSRAKAKIKQHIRQRARQLAVETGRSLLRARLEPRGIDLAELETSGIVASKLAGLGIADERGIERLYELIGDGDLRISEVVRALDPEPETKASESMFGRLLRPFRRKPDTNGRAPREGDAGAPIEIDAARLDSGVVQFAPCCSPLPGDPVVGFRVPSRGIIAHVDTCPVASKETHDRVFLRWAADLELERPVTVRVRTGNTVGLLAEMSRAFSASGLNIKQANCRAFDDGKSALNTFHATVTSLDRLDQLLDRLRDIDGVVAVERVFEGTDD